jgi:CBS domain-containing protein
MQLRDILARKGKALHTISVDGLLGEAVAAMNGLDLGSLIVFDGRQMVGILTFREVLRAVGARGPTWAGLKVGGVMLADPLTATPDTDIDDLRRMMLETHQRYIPVIDDGLLLGVVSFHDVARAVLDEQVLENRMLKNYIHDQLACS